MILLILQLPTEVRQQQQHILEKMPFMKMQTMHIYTLSEAPSYYKEVSVDGDGNLTFGKTVGDVTTLEGLSAELSTETRYGDYQLDIDGLVIN